jgi:hypothetical protein
MSRQNTRAPSVHFPNDAHLDVAAAGQRLALLRNWRSGSAATAIVMGGLLPFAVAWHVRYLGAVAASMIFAAILATGTHITCRRRLATMALLPELVGLADVAAERRRLESARTRRTLAAGLRRTAAAIQPPCRFDPCPVLVDRVAPIRDELLELADDLEETPTPDPACIALIRELLTDGYSPLYNTNLPADDLYTDVARARAGISAEAMTRCAPPPTGHRVEAGVGVTSRTARLSVQTDKTQLVGDSQNIRTRRCR